MCAGLSFCFLRPAALADSKHFRAGRDCKDLILILHDPSENSSPLPLKTSFCGNSSVPVFEVAVVCTGSADSHEGHCGALSLPPRLSVLQAGRHGSDSVSVSPRLGVGDRKARNHLVSKSEQKMESGFRKHFLEVSSLYIKTLFKTQTELILGWRSSVWCASCCSTVNPGARGAAMVTAGGRTAR